MKYLNQVIVLHKHAWKLQEEINILSRVQSAMKDDEARQKLHEEISSKAQEITDTYHAIDLLESYQD
jgi:hypothetical protein